MLSCYKNWIDRKNIEWFSWNHNCVKLVLNYENIYASSKDAYSALKSLKI